MRVVATRPVSFAPVLASLALLIGSASLATGAMAGHVLGGKTDTPAAANNLETDGLARFTVDEHNKRQNVLLEFVRVVEAKGQVVAGTVHHLTLEALKAGRNKIYEAKVWVKPWLNFKELQEFVHTRDATSFTTSDLGAKKGTYVVSAGTVRLHISSLLISIQ